MKYLTLLLCLAFSFCKNKSQVNNSGPAADNAVVTTDTADNGIQEKYWKLTELMGKPTPPTPQDAREIHIKFRKAENRIEGFAGCNGIGGSYELKAGDRIKMSNILRTQMACPDLDLENELIKVLETADNYNLKGDTLVLNKAKMAPLARFHAVYFN